MQQSSATPSLHLGFWGLRKIVACSQSSSQCLLVSMVFGTVSSLLIFNDFYTCNYKAVQTKVGSYNYNPYGAFCFIQDCALAIPQTMPTSILPLVVCSLITLGGVSCYRARAVFDNMHLLGK